MPLSGFNPYKIGVELFKDIERRWDEGGRGLGGGSCVSERFDEDSAQPAHQ